MDELREKIRVVIAEWDDDGQNLAHGDLADRILAIPEIADALLLMGTARRRFCDAVRQASPQEMMLGAFQNAHPWANLLKPEDMI